MLKQFPNFVAINPDEIVAVEVDVDNAVCVYLKSGENIVVFKSDDELGAKKFYSKLVDELNGVEPARVTGVGFLDDDDGFRVAINANGIGIQVDRFEDAQSAVDFALKLKKQFAI